MHLPSRRSFLQHSLTAMAGTVLPLTGAYGQVRGGLNDRIRLALIGTGQRGRTLLKEVQPYLVALCDVDEDHLKRAANLAGPQVRLYEDYRKVLEQPDIDGVIITTPDHWHALQAIHACEAGKAVFIEKPVAKSVEEATLIQEAAIRWGTIVHSGGIAPQQQVVQELQGLVSQGEIGSVSAVHCWAPRNVAGGDAQQYSDVPESLDWKQWQGPALTRPYNSTCIHVNHRWQLSYGGGLVKFSGMDCFETALRCLDRDWSQPVHIEAQGEAQQHGLWDCPESMEASLQWEDGFSVHWAQGEHPADSTPLGIRLEGSDGSYTLERCGTAQAHIKEHPQETDQPQETTPVTAWIKAIDSGDRQNASLQQACQAAQWGSLINVAYQVNRPLQWSPQDQSFVNDEAANRLLRQPGWEQWR